MSNPNHLLGARAEAAAAAWLAEQGWVVLSRRQRSAVGELDLVAFDPTGVLVAVEVKCRAGGRSGTALEGLQARQLRRLRRCLVEFREARLRGQEVELRVDLVTVEPSPTSSGWRLRRVPQIDAW